MRFHHWETTAVNDADGIGAWIHQQLGQDNGTFSVTKYCLHTHTHTHARTHWCTYRQSEYLYIHVKPHKNCSIDYQL